MPERSSKRKKREHDANVTAFRVVREATGEAEPVAEKPLDAEGKNPHAMRPRAHGWQGGREGAGAKPDAGATQ